MSNEADKHLARAHMEEALQRKKDKKGQEHRPASQQGRPGGITRSETAGKDLHLSRDALDEPTRKRSHTPRTGDG